MSLQRTVYIRISCTKCLCYYKRILLDSRSNQRCGLIKRGGGGKCMELHFLNRAVNAFMQIDLVTSYILLDVCDLTDKCITVKATFKRRE